MSEFRQDSLRRHWVVIAEERAGRPNAYDDASKRDLLGDTACPFCPGNESETPPAIAVDPKPPEPWRIRVVNNKYPAVGRPTAGDPVCPPRPAVSPLQAQPGRGHHEVLIESPDHVLRSSQLDDCQTYAVWRMYQQRLAAIADQGDCVFGRVFQNCGPRAGASIEHLHSQLIALPMVPNDSARELKQLEAWRTEHGGCGHIDLIQAELDDGSRVIAEEDGLIAFCPYASRLPYEVWVSPITQAASFVDAPHRLLETAGRLLRRLAEQLDYSLQKPDYNYLIQTAPFDRSAEDLYHWRIELFPRLTTAAGFEISSGCYINPVSPEKAADTLRNVRRPKAVE
jgi:UDPglucose--hexose-1-phosphate uridylyltransferase